MNNDTYAFLKNHNFQLILCLVIVIILAWISIIGTVPLSKNIVDNITMQTIDNLPRMLAATFAFVFAFIAFRIYRNSFGKSKNKFFFSFPMSVWGSQDYEKQRREAFTIISSLENNLKFSDSYFSGENIESTMAFETHSVAAETDLLEIENCELFIMVFPEKMSSSVICEAGYALALNKPSLYFVKNRDDLPYIMRGLGEVRNKSFPAVRIETFTDYENLKAIIKSNGERLIPKK